LASRTPLKIPGYATACLITNKQTSKITLAMANANKSTFGYNIFPQLEKGQKIKLRQTEKINNQ